MRASLFSVYVTVARLVITAYIAFVGATLLATGTASGLLCGFAGDGFLFQSCMGIDTMAVSCVLASKGVTAHAKAKRAAINFGLLYLIVSAPTQGVCRRRFNSPTKRGGGRQHPMVRRRQ